MASSINASTSGVGGVITTADASGVLDLQTADTTRMTIDVNGNVGIGTNSPSGSSKLHVIGDMRLARSSTASDAAIYFGSANTNYIYGGNGLNLMAFTTNNAERMRIDASGQVGIGITPTTQLDVKVPNSGNALRISNASGTANYNAALFYNNATTSLVGYINVSGSTTNYVSTSDYRLKENVKPMVGALDKVAELKPVTYKWKADGSDGQGFIAHELQAVVPDCVVGEKDAVNEDGSIKPQGIDTSFLVATLTAAIQELKAIIDTQAERIAVLENK